MSDGWEARFRAEFLAANQDDAHEDLVFYVAAADSPAKPAAPPYEVRRRTAPPPAAAPLDWRRSYLLSAVVNALRYTLLVELYHREPLAADAPAPARPAKRLLRRVARPVYASPSRCAMDEAKAAEVVHTYPLIFFGVNDFNDALRDLAVDDHANLVAVRLVVAGGALAGRPIPPLREDAPRRAATIFSGALGIAAIRAAYAQEVGRLAAHAAAAASPLWLRFSAPASGQDRLPAGEDDRSRVFVNLKGPGGAGDAQLALVQAASLERPRDRALPDSSRGSLSSLWRALSAPLSAPALPPHVPPDQAAAFHLSITFVSVHWEEIVAKVEAALDRAQAVEE